MFLFEGQTPAHVPQKESSNLMFSAQTLRSDGPPPRERAGFSVRRATKELFQQWLNSFEEDPPEVLSVLRSPDEPVTTVTLKARSPLTHLATRTPFGDILEIFTRSDGTVYLSIS